MTSPQTNLPEPLQARTPQEYQTNLSEIWKRLSFAEIIDEQEHREHLLTLNYLIEYFKEFAHPEPAPAPIFDCIKVVAIQCKFSTNS